jgi:hypothetical protein
MIDDSSASEAGPTEMREKRRGWAAPSRRGLMGAGAGLLAVLQFECSPARPQPLGRRRHSTS